MEIIVKYKAVDGREFLSEIECRDHECLVSEVDNIMKSLTPKPRDDGCFFSNGGGYLQHTRYQVNKTRAKLLEIASRHIDHRWIQDSIDDKTIDPSWVGRLISDYGFDALIDAWYRISCIDKSFREWGQPYYALNPMEGKQIQLNG